MLPNNVQIWSTLMGAKQRCRCGWMYVSSFVRINAVLSIYCTFLSSFQRAELLSGAAAASSNSSSSEPLLGPYPNIVRETEGIERKPFDIRIRVDRIQPAISASIEGLVSAQLSHTHWNACRRLLLLCFWCSEVSVGMVEHSLPTDCDADGLDEVVFN